VIAVLPLEELLDDELLDDELLDDELLDDELLDDELLDDELLDDELLDELSSSSSSPPQPVKKMMPNANKHVAKISLRFVRSIFPVFILNCLL
jgi:hypothetical protein